MTQIKVVDKSVGYRVKLWWSKADRAGIHGIAEWEIVGGTINTNKDDCSK